MSDEIEIIEPGIAVAETQLAPSSTLWGTDDYGEILTKATDVSAKLADVIRQRDLAMNIKGKEYVLVGGWQLLGTMLGVQPIVVDVDKVDDEKGKWAESDGTKPGKGGYRAHVEVRNLSGQLVGGAYAECRWSEDNWATSDAYAVLSMAQTRAISKSLRGPLGFVMELAGYSATPAEEMMSTRIQHTTDDTQPKDVSGHECPACGDAVIEGTGKQPPWKCSNWNCVGLTPEEDEAAGKVRDRGTMKGRPWPWSTWEKGYFDSTPQSAWVRLVQSIRAAFPELDDDTISDAIRLEAEKQDIDLADLSVEDARLLYTPVKQLFDEA